MNGYSLERLRSEVSVYAADFLGFFRAPSTFAQLAVVAICFLAAWVLDILTRDAVERGARRIRGTSRLLRIVAAIRRRMRLVLFVLLLWISTLFDTAAEGPRSQVLSIVLDLSLAYLVIAIASKIIRNHLLSSAIAVVCWGLAALSILDLAAPVSVALDSAAISVGQSRISALLVLKAFGILAIALWLASLIGHFLDARVQRSTELTPTLRVLIGKFLRIGLILLALAVALGTVGVDLTALTVLSGALGVGLGFGLQKVVSNFISGVIILLDRSIKPGDTISLGDTFGWIRELRARFVSVVTRDGREYLIPNEDFITNQVINWSFTNEMVRVDVKFGVAYDSDPHAVICISKEAAGRVRRVLSEKPIVCWITGFGDSSIDFVLRFWICDPQEGLTNVKGEVLLALWDAFKINGISIPFPQREVTVRMADAEKVHAGRTRPLEPQGPV